MTIPFAFVPLNGETLDAAGASVKRDQQLTAFQLPNYQVVFAIPTAMFEAFFNCAAQFLDEANQQELLLTLGSRATSAAEHAEYEEAMREERSMRVAA